MQTQEPSVVPTSNDAANLREVKNTSAISRDNTLHLPIRIVDVLSDYTVLGVLIGFTPGEVAILVDETLSEQREVEVHLDPFSFAGQTLYCRPNGEQYEAHVSIDDLQGAGLRKTPRFPVMIPAELLLPSQDSVVITIRDLSRDGMGIESPIPLKAGQPIAIVSGPAFVFAIVRHCQQMPRGVFRAGVEMHHLFEKPPQLSIEPPHPARQGCRLRRWTSKLFSARPAVRPGSQSEVARFGVTEVGP